jgi:hypothetical protein
MEWKAIRGTARDQRRDRIGARAGRSNGSRSELSSPVSAGFCSGSWSARARTYPAAGCEVISPHQETTSAPLLLLTIQRLLSLSIRPRYSASLAYVDWHPSTLSGPLGIAYGAPAVVDRSGVDTLRVGGLESSACIRSATFLRPVPV